MAKGAGMIAPNMATMLAVICTDASLGIDDAQRLVANAAALSFNRASVDDHTSTNDTFLLLASGRSEPLAGQELEQFGEVISGIAIQLAKEMVADGEGASHVMVIQVVGADDDQAAESIARRVAASPLVKTAIAGGDPNWGRIVSAAGNAGPPIDADRISLEICRTPIFQQGTPLAIDATALSQTMSAAAEVEIKLTVGAGSGQATYFASDLTTEYVRFNSEYTT